MHFQMTSDWTVYPAIYCRKRHYLTSLFIGRQVVLCSLQVVLCSWQVVLCSWQPLDVGATYCIFTAFLKEKCY